LKDYHFVKLFKKYTKEGRGGWRCTAATVGKKKRKQYELV
jgi:hypothetical protein